MNLYSFCKTSTLQVWIAIPLEVTLIVEGAENVHLQFIDEDQKMKFVAIQEDALYCNE